MPLYSFEGRSPVIASTAYISLTGQVIGDVEEKHDLMALTAVRRSIDFCPVFDLDASE